ncbi:glycosyltransferase family 2 protein [Serratia sp. 2723]|uniref:glycosyltransferase family 2 protein n=1 Tax=unclassified Serratia (in: enterobacteria) TaxID=2647522 RepID=UPI003D1C5D0E
MKVSIITPTYNSEKFIKETYSSIFRQTYTNWEWLVTDDCSDDATKDILAEIAQQDSRVRVFHNEKNSGAAVSRNVSLSHVSGAFIAFIDSDDIWLPTKLEEQVKFMDEDKNFSFTPYFIITEDGNDCGKVIDMNVGDKIGYRDLLKKKATLGCSTVMIRNNGTISMPLRRTGQDYALWLSMLRGGEKHAYIYKAPLTKYRIVKGSISRNKFKKAISQWGIYRKVEKLGYFDSAVFFVHYAYRAVFR